MHVINLIGTNDAKLIEIFKLIAIETNNYCKNEHFQRHEKRYTVCIKNAFLVLLNMGMVANLKVYSASINRLRLVALKCGKICSNDEICNTKLGRYSNKAYCSARDKVINVTFMDFRCVSLNKSKEKSSEEKKKKKKKKKKNRDFCNNMYCPPPDECLNGVCKSIHSQLTPIIKNDVQFCNLIPSAGYFSKAARWGKGNRLGLAKGNGGG